MNRLFACLVACAVLAAPGLSASAATKAGNYQGCVFDACQMDTAECCRLASEQEAACRAADQANDPNYSEYGQEGADANKEIDECVRCSGVFLKTFCEKQ